MRSPSYKDFVELLILLLISVFFIYFTSPLLSKALFLFVLFKVWATEKDYFWFAFVLVILCEPGGIFGGGELSDTKRLPLYNILPGLSFSFIDLYLIIIALKAFKYRSLFVIEIKNELLLLLLVFFISILIGLTFGAGSGSIIILARTVIEISLFYSVFFVFRTFDNFYLFIRTIFPFVFIALVIQVIGLLINAPLVSLLKDSSARNLYFTSVEGGFERPIEFVVVNFICYYSTFYFLTLRNQLFFKKQYLYLINLVSLLSISLSATRSWTLTMILSWGLFALVKTPNLKFNGIKNWITLIFLFFIIMQVPVIQGQLESAWDRLSTVSRILDGDLSLGGSARRFDYHAPMVMQAFKGVNPIFGAGFSDVYFENENFHVGYHTFLLNTGYFGSIILIAILARLIIKNGISLNPIKTVVLLPLLSLIIINASVQVLGWRMSMEQFLFNEAIVFMLISKVATFSVDLAKLYSCGGRNS